MTAAAHPYVAPSIAALALIFTAVTFWWLQLRRGELRVIGPETYSGFVAEENFRLRLPLTFTNTGAKEIPVVDLRLKIEGEARLAPSQTFRSTVRPLPDGKDISDVAHPFTVPGRSTVVKIVEFGSPDWAPGGDMLSCTIEARTEQAGWDPVLMTEIELPEDLEDRTRYIAHHRTSSRASPSLAIEEPPRSDGIICPSCGAFSPPGRRRGEVCPECFEP